MSPDAQAFFITAIIIFVLSLIINGINIYLMVRHKRRWYVILPVLFWSLHLSVFYGFALYARMIGTNLANLFLIEDFGEIWSSIQRLHGVITFLYLLYILHIEMEN